MSRNDREYSAGKERKMKKQWLVWIVVLWISGMTGMAESTIFVPDEGDTGWRTYNRTFQNGFLGTVGFVASDVGDSASLSPVLLIDNLSHAAIDSNSVFERWNSTGYVLSGMGGVTGRPFSSGPSPYYTPTQGRFMFFLKGSGGKDTSAFINNEGARGKTGTILETRISVAAGDAFSFDWAFLGTDVDPFTDFSAVYFRNADGAMEYQDILGQIGQAPIDPGQIGPAHAPEPSTMLLLGFGLVGLAGIARKK
jgi:hypothetical protein